MKFTRTYALALLFAASIPGCVRAQAEPGAQTLGGEDLTPAALLVRGQERFSKGDFDKAIEYWAGAAARTSSGKIGVDAVQMALDILTQSPEGWAIISGFAAEHNLPIVGATELQVRNGAILTYISDNFETGRMGAVLADKILKGAPPGTIPVVTPEGYLRVNYRTIQKLGLAAPEGLLSRAKEIIR